MTRRIILGGLAIAAMAVSGAVELRPGKVNVVVRQGAEPPVEFAASELTNYLARVLGAPVPVASAPARGQVNVFLGENEWSRAESLDPKPLVRDGFISAAKGGSIFLLGVDDTKINPRGCYTGHPSLFGGGNFERGTLNAVYEFLERYADVRFFWPGELGTVVDRRASLSVPEGVRRVEPVFTERYFGWWNTAKDGWHDKSQSVMSVTAHHWLQLRYGSSRKQCCHGQRHFRYVPRFGKSHPEWFCLKADGTRNLTDGDLTWRNSKLCYTSPIREELYQDVKAFLSGAPASSRGLKAWGQNCVSGRAGKYVDVMPEDGFNECKCERCQAAYDKTKRMYANDLIWGLTAEIASRLQKEGVPGDISQMAYPPYGDVPAFNLPTNIQVMVAVNGPWSTSTPERHAAQMKRLRDWTAKLGHKVWLWTYPGKYAGRSAGIPEISARAYAKFFSEAAPYIFGGYLDNDTDRYMYEAQNVYVFAKLAWDPSLDIEALLDDWNARLFGPAKAEMKAVYDLLERKWVDGVCKGRMVESALGPVTVTPGPGQLWTAIYSPAAIAELRRLFDAAAAKVREGSLEARRIALLRKEFLDSLARLSSEADPAVELRRRAKEKPVNLIANGDFDTADGWRKFVDWGKTELDADCKVTGKASAKIMSDTVPHRERNVQGEYSVFVNLSSNRTYRLSYFIKTKDVVPYTGAYGAGLCLWMSSKHYIKHPNPYVRGTCGWMHQSHVFRPPISEAKTKLQFRLEEALGTMWIDGVLLEDITGKTGISR